jgi:hypothetical protein
MPRKRAHVIGLICALTLMSSCVGGVDSTEIESSQLAQARSTGTGLKAEYFSDMALGTLVLTRVDSTVNFDWGTGAPASGLATDRFSVRWTGQIEALYSETYTFYTQSDDGIRLWVNGRQIINNWTDHATIENSGTIALSAGQRYDLKLEYHENSNEAVAKLSWSGAHTSKQIVPQAQLYLPSAGILCGAANQDGTMTLACPSGQTIATVSFASYGTPSGSCGAFTAGTCNASTSMSAVSSACIGKSTCSVGANQSTFGDPCTGTTKHLYAQVTCAGATGTGGTTGTGGSTGTGGLIGTGGAPSTGGSPALGNGTGLKAEYYNGMTFDTLVLTRIDPTVNFDWGAGSPSASVNVDRFSARWTGQVQPLYSQTYTFYAQSDDGIRLWVNGQLLIDNCIDHALTEDSGRIALTAGQKYDIKIEYYENSNLAQATLSWSSSSQAKQIVPQSQLFPAAGSSPDAGSGDTSSAGGKLGAGGRASTGGSIGTGGTSGTGGKSGTGGTSGTGGKSGTGGSTGTGGIGAANCTYSNTIQLIGNQILDTSGTAIVARGPEMVVATTDNTLWIDTAANMGANAARLLLTLDAVNCMTPASFDTLIARAVSHNMIVWLSLYTWDSGNNHVIGSALGGGNFYSLAAPGGGTCSTATPAPCYLAVWSRQWLKDLVAKYKGHVIIDAMQEYIGVADASTEAGRTEWANVAQSNVRWFRTAGYTEPLEIMSNYQGRDLYAIVEKGASIRSADSLVVNGYPQTMFGWQAYWASDWYKSWQGGLLLGSNSTITGAQAMHQFATTQQFPIEIGLDNYAGDTGAEYQTEMDQAATDRASWLWWSWTGSNTVECPNNGATCQAYVTSAQSGFVGAVRSVCGL